MIGRRASAVVGIVAIAALALGGMAWLIRVLPSSSGAVIEGTNGGFTAAGAEVVPLPGTSTAFRPGDIVTRIAGSALDTWPPTAGSVPSPGAGPGTVPATVLRDDAKLDLAVPLAPFPLADHLTASVGTLAFVLLMGAAGGYVYARRPRDPAAVGLLMISVGVLGSTPAYLVGIDPLEFARGTALITFPITVLVYHLIWAGGLHFALTFPRPHPWVARHPRGIAVPYLLIYAGLGVAAVVSVALGPPGLEVIATFNVIGGIVTLIALPVTLLLIASAWRRSRGADRRMLRALVVTALLAVVGGFALQYLPEVLVGRPVLPWSVAAVMGIPFVVALALAVLRHQAFDIQVVVNRSVVYGGLTLAVLGIYAAVVALLRGAIQAESDATVALVGTAVAALAALPIRDALQAIVNRAMYGDRDEPMRALRRLGDRLSLTGDPVTLPRVIVATVADALRLPYVALEVQGPEGATIVAVRGAAPTDPADVVAIPLVARSMPVGRLLLAGRDRGEPLTAADRRLLDDLSPQVASAVDNLLLTDALRRSRERIVSAREEERRRIRRDLHDGVGPALVAIGMQAEAGYQVGATDPGAARERLRGIQIGIDAAVGDIRRLVEGLRPPALDELGLVGALEKQAEGLGVGGPAIAVESPGTLDELPAAVEVAAYRIAVEAMTNAVRHAGADRCEVRVRVEGTDGSRRLAVEVADDGSGLPPAVAPGVGLASMRERAAEIGGEVRVERRDGTGTRVRAWLPLGSA